MHSVMELANLACEQGEGRKGKRKRKQGACRNGQGFRFPNDSNLCHVQINCSGRKHNKNN